MCDTILAPPQHTAAGVMLYGKNSDRQRNEAQTVDLFARSVYGADEHVACTYISIPQAPRTHAVLLCRPYWMWGAEMGANEHGVAIGNQAVHARIPAAEQEALLGDDLVRLGLERAASAAEAVEVITSLLQQYGQGGNNGHVTRSYFNNAFMIADAKEAFVLETIGREWLLDRVTGLRSMSNRYSIEERVVRTSAGLASVIGELGGDAQGTPHYAQVLANPNREHIGQAGARRQCSTALLTLQDGTLTALDMMRILRDHGTGEHLQPQWHAECAIRRTLCMHAGPEDSPGQTTGSMISELKRDTAVHWVTGSAAPCTSIFKPVLLDVPLPPSVRPSERFDAASLWWSHERLHRTALLTDLNRFLSEISAERDALERDFSLRIREVSSGGTSADRAHVVADCWRKAMKAEQEWFTRMDTSSSTQDSRYVTAWETMSERVGLDLRAGADARESARAQVQA